MDMTEHRLSSQTIYDGKIVRLRRDIVRLPGGRESVRRALPTLPLRLRRIFFLTNAANCG